MDQPPSSGDTDDFSRYMYSCCFSSSTFAFRRHFLLKTGNFFLQLTTILVFLLFSFGFSSRRLLPPFLEFLLSLPSCSRSFHGVVGHRSASRSLPVYQAPRQFFSVSQSSSTQWIEEDFVVTKMNSSPIKGIRRKKSLLSEIKVLVVGGPSVGKSGQI